MRCLRLLTTFVILCGLAGTARASQLLVTDPVPPAARAFGNVAVGTTGTATIKIRSCSGGTTNPCNTNAGSETTINAFTGAGSCAEFAVVPPPALPVTLQSDGTQTTFTITYTPTNRGADSCTFTVDAAGGDGDTTITVTGTGTAALLAVQTPVPPAALSFADQPYNVGLGETKNITIVNSGNVAITAGDITASLPANADFTIGALVGLPIAPAGTATLPVTFNPASTGNKSGTVTFTVTNDLPGDPNLTVTLSGKGTQSVATVPASVVFAAGAVGAARNANLVVMNTGDGPLNISSMTIAALPNGPDFKFTDHGCNNQVCNTPGAIAAGASSTFTLTCTPSAAGLRAATMTIASDDGTTGTRTVVLKCTGNNLALGSDKIGPPATAPQNVAIANGGAAAITYSVVSSVPAEFPVTCVGGCAGRTLAAGASETVAVTFQAAAAGARTATLTFTTTDADTNNATVNLTGTGTAPTIAVAPSPVAFSDVPIVQVGGATTNATVTNGGDAPLVISQMTITNDPTNQFSFATVACGNGHTCNDTITVANGAPGNTATVTLRCDPDAAGDKTANLVINSDAPTSPTTIPLTCTGTVPDVVVSEMMLDFGNQRVGVASAPAKSFTVTNSAAAHTAPLTYTVSETSAEYSISCTGGANCTGTLTAGQSITVSVVFTPTSAGVKADNITVVTPDDPDEPMTLVMVTGTGRLPSIAVAPSPLDVGDVPVALAGGATAATTVTNDGLVALVVSSMAITGDAEGNFSFATAACPNGAACNTPFTLQAVAAPGNQAAVTLRCDPAAAGDKTANLVITSDAVTSPTTVPVTCKGTVPDVALSTMMLDFMTQRVGTPSAAQTFTVSNSAAAHTAPLAYTVSETSADYAITCTGAANCTGTLAAGESITVSVVFTPTGLGVKAANITVATPTDPDEASTLVMVTGTGVEPAVTVVAPAPAPLALGDVDVNATSAAGTITLRNSGTSDLSITAATLTGGDAAQFAITGGGVGAQTVSSTAGSNTHSWTVTCTPTSIGAKTTTFRVTHDAPVIGTQTNIAVTCTGRAAIFTPSVVAPAKLDFGQVELNTDSLAKTFTLTNTGNKAGKVMMLTSTSNVFVPTTMANLALDVAPGASITVSVVFHPVTTQLVTESVCAINTGLTSPVCVAVTGDGQSIGLDVSPQIDFGAVRFDAGPQTSANVTITNTGESSVRVDTITSSGAPFTIVNGPVLPITLNLNQTTTFKVRLTPTMALGSVSKTVSVAGAFTVSGAPASGSIPVTARITAPQVAMTTDTLDFGMFDVDDPGDPITRSVTITNTSDAATGSDLHVAAPVLTAGAPDFAIVNGAPATVAPGASATVMVRFDPTTAGQKIGEITLGIDAITGMTYTVALRGLAIDQNVVCSPAMITFPATVRRQASTPVDEHVTNLDFVTGPGTAATLAYTATITGANAGDFSLPAADAAGTIAGNAMKSLPITFTPAAAGAGRTANLVISYDDGGPRSCMVTLVGEGRLRQINVTPGTIDFGTLAVGATVRLSEVASVLQLTSTEPAGATAATVTKLATSGAAATAFTVIDGTTAKPLPTGGHVEYDVEFAPTEAGVFQADVDVFFDDDPEAQYTFHMTGRAVDIDLHGGGCDSGGGGAGVLVGLAALGLALGRRRRARTVG